MRAVGQKLREAHGPAEARDLVEHAQRLADRAARFGVRPAIRHPAALRLKAVDTSQLMENDYQ
jgi:hypothetical protein